MIRYNIFILSITIALTLFFSSPAWAMHIMEGYLPLGWSLGWTLLSLPFIIFGYFSIQRTIKDYPRVKLMLAMAGAFVFVLSALKIPSVTGSCSHPTGVGFGAILFGPTAMSVLGLIVLLFQAVLLAHGGITTLGANVFSMAVVGPMTTFGVYKLVKRLNGPRWLAVFLGAFCGDLFTYIVTSAQLALAFPMKTGGITGSLSKFMSIFAITQIPLAVSEGILTVLIINALVKYSEDELIDLKVLTKGV